MKRVISIFAAVGLCLCLAIPAAATTPPLPKDAESANLKFNADGKFKIIQVADLQEAYTTSAITREFLLDVAEKERPDLFVLSGDNIASGPANWGLQAISRFWVKRSIHSFMRVFDEIYEKYGIPVTMVFGNHDAEMKATSREQQFAIYSTYKSFIGFKTDADKGTKDEQGEHVGTHNLVIKNNAGTANAFNLWLFDSGAYDPRGGYGHVQTPQLNWFTKTNDALGKLPSLAFQHIIVPEIYDVLTKTNEGAEDAIAQEFVNANGELFWQHFSKALPANAKGAVNEAPCPGRYNDGQYDLLKNAGNVMAIFSGHDHVNSFEVPGSVDLVNTASVGFGSYGDAQIRGVRVITLNESNLNDYGTELVLYKDFYPDTWLRRTRLSMYDKLHTFAVIFDFFSFRPMLWIAGLFD